MIEKDREGHPEKNRLIDRQRERKRDVYIYKIEYRNRIEISNTRAKIQ